VHIESFVQSWAEDPPPRRITGEHGGTLGAGMTAGVERVFIAVVAGLIDQLKRGERAR
jgi:hypothetical protein